MLKYTYRQKATTTTNDTHLVTHKRRQENEREAIHQANLFPIDGIQSMYYSEYPTPVTAG